MTQQTAVQWLETTIQAMIENGGDLGEDYPALIRHIEKAKAMEKEQIIDACFEGMCCFPFDANRGRAEQYYEQTYKK